jgi:hypothetical protein
MKIGRTSITILILIIAFTLAACGSAGSSGSGGADSTDNLSSSITGSMDDGYPYLLEEQVRRYDYELAESEGGFYRDQEAPVADNTIPEDRKVIKNADLEIMADDASALYGNIAAYAAQLGGYEHSYSIYNHETYSIISAELKIPPEKLGVFVTFIGENGDIINSSMRSEDITENYFDAKTRLDTKRRSLESYYQLLRNASGVEEIVSVQRIIDGITEDIESLEGRLNLWNSQVSMATVNLHIRQHNDPMQIRKEINWNTLSTDDMGYLIKQGFFSITNGIVSILQWIIVILVGYSPIWIMLAIGVLLWIKIRKKFNILKVFRKKNE